MKKIIIALSVISMILIPASVNADSMLNLQIGSEKYTLGQNIVIQGNITLKPTDPKGFPITYEVIDPSGNVIDAQTAQVGNNEFFITIHTGDGTKITNAGTYGLIVYYGNPNPNLLNTAQSARVSFTVGSLPSTQIESNPTSQERSQPSSSPNNYLMIFVVIIILAIIGGIAKSKKKSVGSQQLPRRGWSDSERKQILERQGGKCAMCGEYSGSYQFDHKDNNRSNNNLRNGQALCPNCHDRKSRGLN